MRRFGAGLIGIGSVAALACAAALAAGPVRSATFSGNGAQYMNDGPHWMRYKSQSFSFKTSSTGTRVLAFRGYYYYYCGAGTAAVVAKYMTISAAGKFSYRFSVRQRYGVVYVQISGSFLKGGRRARVSYLVDFVDKGHRVPHPYDAARPRSLGCATLVKGSARAR